jgi:Lrp/AsnC family transcriptional regulator, leucine-responsive regulatory protein
MIDEISLQIIRILQKKARIPNVEVARKVGMAPSAVLERIRKLEKLGIIDGYEVRLNPARFGREMVAFVSVGCTCPGGDDALGRRLAAIPAVQEVHYLSGEDAFLLKLRVGGTRELGQVLREQIAPLEGIGATRTRIALTTYKETFQIPPEIPA